MDTLKELNHHIITEFARNYNYSVVLNEEHGYINNIDEVIEYFKELVSPQIELAFADKPEMVRRTYDDKITVKAFFEYYKLNITFEPSDKTAYSGGMLPSSVYVHPIKGEWVCVPDIKLIIKANNAINAMKTFSFCIGHELTHCYDLLEYAKETGQDPWYSIDRNKYFAIQKSRNNSIQQNAKATANILYRLNRMERNAYIAQLRQELLDRKDEIKDSASATEAIKNTESYKNFAYLENNIIYGICNVKDKALQKGLIQYLNDNMGTKFTTYNQLKKYYLDRWQKWKNKYLSTASKIAYDIFASDKRNLWLDSGMFGKEEPSITGK